MRVQSDGVAGVGRLPFWLLRLSRWLRPLVAHQVELRAAGVSIDFRAQTYRDFFRATTLFTKEAGTVEWLRSELRNEDIFYDIGANVGIYSLLAAAFTRGAVRVYAFEPHAVNFVSLLENIRLNGFEQSINACNLALNDADGFFPFNYNEFESGSTASQLDGTAYDEFVFEPLLAEIKQGTSLDHFLTVGAAPPPTLIKIDVDGNELRILRGMRALLTGTDRPRAIQVELNLSQRTETLEYLERVGYPVAERHFTLDGKAALAAGSSENEIPFNIICRPR